MGKVMAVVVGEHVGGCGMVEYIDCGIGRL